MEMRNKLLNVYEICKRKFDIHLEKYEGIYEFSGNCKTGDYYSECGKTDFYHMYNWMTSFITGLAPMFYKTSKDEKYLSWADRMVCDYHDKIFYHSLDTMHDLGFLYSPYSVDMYKITDDLKHKETALKAADELLKRFDIKGNYIDAWGRMDDDKRTGRAIVDCMMNIQLLFWAWKETGYTIYRDMAKAHADTTVKYFVREDYSVCHSFLFNRKTGEMIKEANDCGYSNGSYWSRGASWAIYGYAIAYNYTKDEKYLDTSIKLLEKFMRECKNKAPLWDFKLPEFEEQSIDTSAAAVVLCGVLELQKTKHSKKLENFESILKTILDEYVDYDENVMGVLKEQNGLHHYTSYGDYYMIEAYMKKYSDLKVW